MGLLDNFKLAFSSIMSHKLRSALTMLGIIIGVGSIIAIVAMGQGGEAALKSQLAGTGNNTIEIIFEPSADTYSDLNFQPPPFTEQDVINIEKIPEVENVITSNTQSSDIFHGDISMTSNVIGGNNNYFKVNPINIVSGRRITSNEFDSNKKVVMINENLKKKLFQNVDPIGEIIEIRGYPFKVVGVYAEKNQILGLDIKNAIISLNVWPFVYGTEEVTTLTIQSKSLESLENAGNKTVNFLNNTKNIEGLGQFQAFNLKDLQEAIGTITKVMTGIIGGVASISLLVGGIGIMNIMLVSVTERTREIGVRKALGATRANILTQFLIEAITICLFGGFIGVLVGIGGVQLISMAANWPPLISLPVILFALLFSVVMGVVFGLLPANKAAKLDPIESLRYE
ncbi:ABC transporter permease [Rossellomorea aquimaris]|nr:ABC transporter permease [Rossellomorea aquimaris]WRP06597.1 ABC transporter permease [Rossellomorea aquimaris]